MKKWMLTIAAVLSLGIFAACGNDDAENDGNNGNDTIMEQNDTGTEDFYDQDPNDSHNDHADDAIDLKDEDTL
jgi:hypothetical protein